LHDEHIWLRLRQYVDGAEEIEVVLSQLHDAVAEIEELALAGYVLERPVEADGLRLSRGPIVAQTSENGAVGRSGFGPP
jgi:hypothetical protein